MAMGSALGKCISKGAKICPKRLKCCASKRAIKKQNSHRNNEAEASQSSETHDEGRDMCSVCWDIVFCKCCAPGKRMFVADKLNFKNLEASMNSTTPQLLPTLTFMDSVRIHPTNIVHDEAVIQTVLKI